MQLRSAGRYRMRLRQTLRRPQLLRRSHEECHFARSAQFSRKVDSEQISSRQAALRENVLSENVAHDVCLFHSSQLHVKAAKAVSELRMIDTKAVQNRGM
jgi:hypothetical protein